MVLGEVLYRIKSWLRHQLTARHTGGHGIHSPYLFEWVRMVMSDKNGYYVWEDIESRREKMLIDERELVFVDYGSGASVQGEERVLKVCDIAKKSLAKKQYAQMLARLVHWLGGKEKGLNLGSEEKGLHIVELGTSLGITTAYLAAMDSRNQVLTFEGCSAVAAIANENWKSLNINNIKCIEGEIRLEYLRKLDKADVVFIDANHTGMSTQAYFDVLAGKVHDKSVIVVDDIHYNEDMERTWRRIWMGVWI